jgi:ATP-dependent DNA ligase
MISRNGRDHTRRFHDLAMAVGKLSARTLVLDGEIAIYDQQLRSRFDCCASRTQTPSRRRRCSWRSTCCTGRPLHHRRARLGSVSV